MAGLPSQAPWTAAHKNAWQSWYPFRIQFTAEIPDPGITPPHHVEITEGAVYADGRLIGLQDRTGEPYIPDRKN